MESPLLKFIRSVYNRLLRYRLPRVLGVYSGVATKKYYLLDLTANDYEPDYKRSLVSAIRSTVQTGDTVVEVGAGFGVCTVWLARDVGPSGRVISYEGSREQLVVTEEAIRRNGEILEEDLASRTCVTHALVGLNREVYGPLGGADFIAPDNLPECDMLVTDCEGAELEILQQLEAKPERMVIETHPEYGVSTNAVESLLSERGYTCHHHGQSDGAEGSKDILVATSGGAGCRSKQKIGDPE